MAKTLGFWMHVCMRHRYDTDPKSPPKVHLQMKVQEKATLEFHTCDAPLLCWKVRGNSDSLKRTVAQHALTTNERECGAFAQARKDALASRQAARTASAAQRLC